MCGRTACFLAPDNVCKACARQNKNQNENLNVPTWIDHPGYKTYYPSVNIAPSCYTPVLFKSSLNVGSKRAHDGAAKSCCSEDQYSIMPMRWGLIPSFFKGASATEYTFKTNNCRIEGIEGKATYKPSLVKGQRCVVLCNGFYEWQTTKGAQKQPYFIHAPQTNLVELWNVDSLAESDMWSDIDGWKGPRLLMMAGLYSHWISSEHEEIYSYSVITMESGENFSWLHHRVPAILETFDDVDNWLDNGAYNEKISRLTNKVNICWYKVSKMVNNSRNKEPSIIKPIEDEEKKTDTTKSQKLMSSWLKSSSTTKLQSSTIQPKQEKEPKGILKFFPKVVEKQ